MSHLSGERRRSPLGLAVACFVIASLGYLTIAALHGENGLFRLLQMQAQELAFRDELVGLQSASRTLAQQTQGLSEESLDLELLDNRARAVLGVADANEIIVR